MKFVPWILMVFFWCIAMYAHLQWMRTARKLRHYERVIDGILDGPARLYDFEWVCRKLMVARDWVRRGVV